MIRDRATVLSDQASETEEAAKRALSHVLPSRFLRVSVSFDVEMILTHAGNRSKDRMATAKAIKRGRPHDSVRRTANKPLEITVIRTPKARVTHAFGHRGERLQLASTPFI